LGGVPIRYVELSASVLWIRQVTTLESTAFSCWNWGPLLIKICQLPKGCIELDGLSLVLNIRNIEFEDSSLVLEMISAGLCHWLWSCKEISWSFNTSAYSLQVNPVSTTVVYLVFVENVKEHGYALKSSCKWGPFLLIGLCSWSVSCSLWE
jgi:hypothetical protein